MEKGKIKVIIKRPDERFGHVTNISTSLENLQKTVEGHIETVRICNGCIMLVNEEGKINDLPVNFQFGRWPCNDMIHGTVIVIGDEGEDFCDVPIDFYTWKMLLKEWGNL